MSSTGAWKQMRPPGGGEGVVSYIRLESPIRVSAWISPLGRAGPSAGGLSRRVTCFASRYVVARARIARDLVVVLQAEPPGVPAGGVRPLRGRRRLGPALEG